MSVASILSKDMCAKSTLAALAVFAAGAACVSVLYYVDPSESSFYPRCPLFLFTGLKCPGCGITRALHCVLHGDIIDAFRHNPFLVIALPLAMIMWIFPSCRNSVVLNRTLLVAGICWWLLRNIW